MSNEINSSQESIKQWKKAVKDITDQFTEKYFQGGQTTSLYWGNDQEGTILAVNNYFIDFILIKDAIELDCDKDMFFSYYEYLTNLENADSPKAKLQEFIEYNGDINKLTLVIKKKARDNDLEQALIKNGKVFPEYENRQRIADYAEKFSLIKAIEFNYENYPIIVNFITLPWSETGIRAIYHEQGIRTDDKNIVDRDKNKIDKLALVLPTAGGDHIIKNGDFIIKTQNGDFFGIDAENFKKRYQKL